MIRLKKGNMILALVIAVLLVGGGYYGIEQWQQKQQAAQDTVEQTQPKDYTSWPEKLGNYRLQQAVIGEQAIKAVGQLHGLNISLTQAAILLYVGEQGQITIWLSENNTPAEAKELFAIMDEKIKGGTTFVNREQVSVAGQPMIHVQGMGLEHYYWQKGTTNYWIQMKTFDEGIIKAVTELP